MKKRERKRTLRLGCGREKRGATILFIVKKNLMKEMGVTVSREPQGSGENVAP